MANFIKELWDSLKLDKARKNHDIQEVFQLMRGSVTDNFNASCIAVLESFGEPAADQLLATLNSVHDRDREQAAQVLGRLKDQITDDSLRTRIVECLVNVTGDGYWPVRYRAIQALGRLYEKMQRPDLKKLAVQDILNATRDEAWRVRYEAIQALGSLYPTMEDPDLKKLAVQAFQRATRDEHERVLLYAGRLLNDLHIAKDEATATPTPINVERPLLRCSNCGARQRAGDWGKAMDARSRAMGMGGFVNINQPEECLKCRSTDLVDASLPRR